MKVKIIDYDHFGRGIAKINEKVIFVPKVKIGDIVDIKIENEKSKYIEGKVINPKSVSYCPYYNLCGSCQIGHLSYDEQLAFKVMIVKNIFSKYTSYSLDDVLILSSDIYNYRNKVTFHIEGEKLGFYEDATNSLIEINKCKLLDENIITLTSSLNSFIKVNKGLNKAMIRSFDNKLMLVLEGVVNDEIVKDFFAPLTSSLYYNNKLLAGTDKLMVNLLGKRFMVFKDSFFQVNKVGVVLIYKEVIRLIKSIKSSIVLDLYCGTGTISLLVSNYVDKVIGIEIVKEAVIDAKWNAKINKDRNVQFYCGDVFKILPRINTQADTVIVDPPRGGLDKKVRDLLLRMEVKNIIYVSCNPITLARDVDYLDQKYELSSIKLVDEFPNTYHVECCSLLKLKEHQED